MKASPLTLQRWNPTSHSLVTLALASILHIAILAAVAPTAMAVDKTPTSIRFQNRNIQVPAYLVSRYLAAGAQLLTVNSSTASNGTLNVGSGSITTTGNSTLSINSGIIKGGSGILTLNGSNTYNGVTSSSNMILTTSSNSNATLSGANTSTGGTLTLTSVASGGNLSVSGISALVSGSLVNIGTGTLVLGGTTIYLRAGGNGLVLAANPVPEPGAWAMLLTGAGALVVRSWRFKRRHM